MRSIFIALFCAALVAAAAGAASRLDAAPQKAAPSEEAAGPPIHAVLGIQGKSLPTDGVCSPHGVHIVWEGDLVECDDDPDGITNDSLKKEYYRNLLAALSTGPLN